MIPEAQAENGARPAEPFGPVLIVRDLRVQFSTREHDLRAIQGIDLEMRRGEILALVGESGSGKSTLGLAIQGLLELESSAKVTGSILVDGQEVVGASKEASREIRRDKLRAVFQDPMTSLNPTMRIGRQLGEACTGGTEPVEWLRRVGISRPEERARAFPHQLSGGQRQRAMIAMAMAAGPALVVADEPTTALDVTVQAQILDLFRRLRDEIGTAFLFITHDLSVAAAIADRIVVLYAGRIVEVGPVLDVAHAPAHPYTAALLGARYGLDADKGHQLPTLEGEPPPAGSQLPGCAFAPRCLLAVAECEVASPPLREVAQHPGASACFRADDVTPRLWQRTSAAWPDGQELGDEPLVRVVDVRRSFSHRRFGAANANRVQALAGVSLEIRHGESVALVGESGSGKSTLLRVVAGLTTPDSGQVLFGAPDRPQMVYQDAYASLTPWLTVGELVGERLRRTGIRRSERRARVADAHQLVGLAPAIADIKPPRLSGGQRQRVAIARAIVVPPRLLLCDEPVSAIDVSLAAAVLNLLGSLRRRLNMAMLFVTHDLAAARFVADRIMVMKEGSIVEIGDADRVVRAPASEYTRALLASIPAMGRGD
jgi:peptide/nickel transport system ATP-binding protein